MNVKVDKKDRELQRASLKVLGLSFGTLAEATHKMGRDDAATHFRSLAERGVKALRAHILSDPLLENEAGVRAAAAFFAQEGEWTAQASLEGRRDTPLLTQDENVMPVDDRKPLEKIKRELEENAETLESTGHQIIELVEKTEKKEHDFYDKFHAVLNQVNDPVYLRDPDNPARKKIEGEGKEMAEIIHVHLKIERELKKLYRLEARLYPNEESEALARMREVIGQELYDKSDRPRYHEGYRRLMEIMSQIGQPLIELRTAIAEYFSLWKQSQEQEALRGRLLVPSEFDKWIGEGHFGKWKELIELEDIERPDGSAVKGRVSREHEYLEATLLPCIKRAKDNLRGAVHIIVYLESVLDNEIAVQDLTVVPAEAVDIHKGIPENTPFEIETKIVRGKGPFTCYFKIDGKFVSSTKEPVPYFELEGDDWVEKEGKRCTLLEAPADPASTGSAGTAVEQFNAVQPLGQEGIVHQHSAFEADIVQRLNEKPQSVKKLLLRRKLDVNSRITFHSDDVVYLDQGEHTIEFVIVPKNGHLDNVVKKEVKVHLVGTPRDFEINAEFKPVGSGVSQEGNVEVLDTVGVDPFRPAITIKGAFGPCTCQCVLSSGDRTDTTRTIFDEKRRFDVEGFSPLFDVRKFDLHSTQYTLEIAIFYFYDRRRYGEGAAPMATDEFQVALPAPPARYEKPTLTFTQARGQILERNSEIALPLRENNVQDHLTTDDLLVVDAEFDWNGIERCYAQWSRVNETSPEKQEEDFVVQEIAKNAKTQLSSTFFFPSKGHYRVNLRIFPKTYQVNPGEHAVNDRYSLCQRTLFIQVEDGKGQGVVSFSGLRNSLGSLDPSGRIAHIPPNETGTLLLVRFDPRIRPETYDYTLQSIRPRTLNTHHRQDPAAIPSGASEFGCSLPALPAGRYRLVLRLGLRGQARFVQATLLLIVDMSPYAPNREFGQFVIERLDNLERRRNQSSYIFEQTIHYIARQLDDNPGLIGFKSSTLSRVPLAVRERESNFHNLKRLIFRYRERLVYDASAHTYGDLMERRPRIRDFFNDIYTHMKAYESLERVGSGHPATRPIDDGRSTHALLEVVHLFQDLSNYLWE